MAQEKRGTAPKTSSRAFAQDTQVLLRRVEKRLRRLAGKRSRTSLARAYRNAADVVHRAATKK